jgi:hypothetical protein
MARRPLVRAIQLLNAFGIDPVKFAAAVRGIPQFIEHINEYRRHCSAGHLPLKFLSTYPCLAEFQCSAGEIGGHYFHQDLWAARQIHKRNPGFHLDVGSRIDGFIAHLLTVMPVTVVDVRELKHSIDGLTFIRSDATHLHGIADRSIPSVSSLHAVEHFGLGRYGDPIDPEACFAAMRALSRVLAIKGRLYFGVPIGRERLEFNAHRIFSPATVLQNFAGLTLVGFSAVDDKGAFHANADPEGFRHAEFSCGLFEFTRED